MSGTNLRTSAIELKSIQLFELEASVISSVWVVNKTTPKGNINITVNDGMGNKINVHIPVVSVPMDLSMQATKQSLLASPQMRQIIAKGMISLKDPDAVNAFLKDPAARAEYNRLHSVGDIAAIGDMEENTQLTSTIAVEAGEIHPFAMTMAVNTDMTDDEVLRDLRAQQDELEKKDFQFIAENSTREKVKAWAAERAV